MSEDKAPDRAPDAEDEALARALCVAGKNDAAAMWNIGNGGFVPSWTYYIPDVTAIRAAGWAPTAALDAEIVSLGAEVDQLSAYLADYKATNDELRAELARLRTVDDAAVERALDAWYREGPDWRTDHPHAVKKCRTAMRAALLAAQQGDGE